MSVTKAAAKAGTGFRELHGVVLSAGLADRTVKVRVGGQKWNKVVKKVRTPPLPPPPTLNLEALPTPTNTSRNSTSTTPEPTSSTTRPTPSA